MAGRRDSHAWVKDPPYAEEASFVSCRVSFETHGSEDHRQAALDAATRRGKRVHAYALLRFHSVALRRLPGHERRLMRWRRPPKGGTPNEERFHASTLQRFYAGSDGFAITSG